jgi:hypothetical protein
VAGVSCEVWHGVYTNEEGKQEEGDACVAKGVGLALAEMTYANPMAQRGHAGSPSRTASRRRPRCRRR